MSLVFVITGCVPCVFPKLLFVMLSVRLDIRIVLLLNVRRVIFGRAIVMGAGTMNKGDPERYGFVRVDGEEVPLTRRGFVVLRIVPIVSLLIIWALFFSDGVAS